MSDAPALPTPSLPAPALPAPAPAPRKAADWAGLPGAKLALVGALLLGMLVPTGLVSSVITEREERQEEVRNDIARGWGPAQTVAGPVLVVPWQALVPAQPIPNVPPQPPELVTGSIQVVPRTLSAAIRLRPEQRRRGLFGAVVYEADVALEGSFAVPGLAVPGHPGAELLWRDAYAVVAATDLRAAPADTALTWDGQNKGGTADLPTGERCGDFAVMGWRLGLDAAPEPGRAIPFSTRFPLRGTGSLRLAPAARDVALTLDAPWDTPSFAGAALPARSDVTADAFHAEWRGGVGLRQAAWPAQGRDCGGALRAGGEQAFGVDLLEAVPTYRMVNRASKYALLFLALSFLTYFLIETAARIRIHLVQYGLLGLSISLFGLLLLSLAEPFGFGAAYALATAAVLAQGSLYTAAVTRRPRLALLFAGVLGGLFGFLYVVLRQETYALLSGTVALFAILSVVMAVTNRLDWSGRRAA